MSVKRSIKNVNVTALAKIFKENDFFNDYVENYEIYNVLLAVFCTLSTDVQDYIRTYCSKI